MAQSIEALQPNPEHAERTGATLWARTKRLNEPLFREGLAANDMDMRKFMQGYVQNAIANDDFNAFQSAFTWQEAVGAFHEESAMQCHIDILERLDWEAHLPEAPDEIKQKLEVVSAQIKLRKFTDNAALLQGYALWEGVRSWVEEESGNNPEWLEAKKYYDENVGNLLNRFSAEINERISALTAA